MTGLSRLCFVLVTISTGLGTLTATAACVFDQSGTISNPNDPSCRDVQLRYTRSNNVGNNIALGYDVPFPVDSLTPVDGFRSYQSLLDRHTALDVENDTVQGSIVGQTIAGRDILAYAIGDADNITVDGGVESAVMIVGGTHAREWQSPEAVTGAFEGLVEAKDDAWIGQYLTENLNTILIPVFNIDGFLITQKYPDRVTADEAQPRDGRMRRKNRRHPNTGAAIDDDIDVTEDNFFGVDLNRNNPNGWGQNGGSSSNPVSLVYRAASPQTEPEIQALIAASNLGPTNRLRLYSDVHSFSQIYFTPMTGNARRDSITQSLVDRMRAVLGNKYRWGPDQSSGIGLTSDYFARTFQIPAWTLETEPLVGGQDYGGTGASHSGFILPDSQVARMRDEIAQMLLAGVYRQADAPRLQAIEIRDSETGELRLSARWSTTPGNARTLNRDTNLGLVPGRDYELWLAFNKPMRWRNGDGNLTNYPGQSVRIFPAITLEFPSQDVGTDLRIDGNALNWLDSPGDDGTGYLRYQYDAVAVTFSVPAGLPPSGSTSAVLRVSAQDMTESLLDADPGSRVDWSNGHWTGYENTQLVEGDSGGFDCNFVTFVSGDQSPAPAQDDVCRALAVTPPPNPNPNPNPNGGGGGGGGGSGLWLLPLLAIIGRWSPARPMFES
jgi:hypothetical protein